MRTAIYARISDDQDGRSTATARQLEDCQRFAEARGWEVVNVYEDSDFSAFKKKVVRPAFERLKVDIEDGRVDAVLVWKLDRLARRARDFVDVDELLDVRKGRIVSMVDGVDTSTSAGRLVAGVMTELARAESENISVRQRRKALEMAQQGKFNGGGSRAFGYSRDRQTIDVEEAAAIREAARRVFAGESIRSILFDWHARGIKGPLGKPWQPFPLKRMLTSALLSGQRDYHGQMYPGTWLAILTPDETTRLRRILEDPARNKRAMSDARSYLLAGFLRCGRCGETLLARPTGEKQRRYVCARRPGHPACGKIARMADPVEELVRDAVFAAIEGPELVEALARASAPNDGDADALITLVRQDEASLAQLARDHYADRVITRAEFLAARDALQGRIEQQRRELNAMASPVQSLDLVALSRNVREEWERRPLEWRRRLLRVVVDHVVIKQAVKGRNTFDPSLIEIQWRV